MAILLDFSSKLAPSAGLVEIGLCAPSRTSLLRSFSGERGPCSFIGCDRRGKILKMHGRIQGIKAVEKIRFKKARRSFVRLFEGTAQ
jgi:hypothetical protein